jgi:hypothetical protein
MSDKFKFDPFQHVYTLDGGRLYGVTSVLNVINKPGLIQWSANEAVKYIEENSEISPVLLGDNEVGREYVVSAKVLEEAKTAHRKKKEKAGEIGTDVHALCEEYVKDCIKDGGMAKNIEHDDPMVQKFISWAIENKVKFLDSERKMYSRELWCAGTCDFIAEINGKRMMGDIKTSSGIYGREYFLQCAGYILMAEEHGEKYDGSIIVRLGKDGSFEVKEGWDLETDKQGFLAALQLFKVLEK